MISTSPSPLPMDVCILVEGPVAEPPPQAVRAMLAMTSSPSSLRTYLEDILSLLEHELYGTNVGSGSAETGKTTSFQRKSSGKRHGCADYSVFRPCVNDGFPNPLRGQSSRIGK